MLKNTAGDKVSPKNKVKELLQKYFDDFNIVIDNSWGKVTGNETAKMQDQLVKLRERINKILVIK